MNCLDQTSMNKNLLTFFSTLKNRLTFFFFILEMKNLLTRKPIFKKCLSSFKLDKKETQPFITGEIQAGPMGLVKFTLLQAYLHI